MIDMLSGALSFVHDLQPWGLHIDERSRIYREVKSDYVKKNDDTTTLL